MNNKKQMKIDRFDNSNNSIICDSYFNFKAGKTLTSSRGVDNAKFPRGLGLPGDYELDLLGSGIDEVKGVTYFKQFFPESGNTQHRLLVYAGDNKVYINQMFYSLTKLNWLFNLNFNSPPLCLLFKKDDMDAMILTSVDKMVVWKANFSPYTFENVPIITSMCMNEGVLFCTIKQPAFKIWYATNLDVESIGNIDSYSNFVTLGDDLGDAKKIITYKEDVYVFRDYGISKIKYVQNNITVSHVYSSNSKIYENTVNVCGNIVVFATKQGIYTFNGTKVAKINSDLDHLLANINDGAVSGSLAGKYYLALKMNFDDNNQIFCEEDEHINNAIIIMDIEDNTYEVIRGVDIGSFLPIMIDDFEKMLVTFNTGHTDKLGEISSSSTCFSLPLLKTYKTAEINSSNNTKLFTKLSVKSNKNITFKFNFDDKSLSFTTYTNGLNEFNFKIIAKSLNLEISTTENEVEIKDLVLDYYDY